MRCSGKIQWLNWIGNSIIYCNVDRQWSLHSLGCWHLRDTVIIWKRVWFHLAIEKIFPHGRRFRPENDPKHTSNYPEDFLSDRSINWWKTPAESPDLNQIENVWGSMKYFLRHQYYPGVVHEVSWKWDERIFAWTKKIKLQLTLAE